MAKAVLAEGVGFEPTIRFPVYTLSKRAPSATRPSLRGSRRAQYSRGRGADNPQTDHKQTWIADTSRQLPAGLISGVPPVHDRGVMSLKRRSLLATIPTALPVPGAPADGTGRA